ncbi:MAG: preprotein translocase subunit SecE [Dehalococcoidia bacterium]
MASARGGQNQVRSMMDEGQTRRRGRLQFFIEIYSELTKVTWPDRQTAARLSLLVIGVAAVMGVFLGLWDLAFSEIVERLFL